MKTLAAKTGLAVALCALAVTANADPLPTFTDSDEGFTVLDLGPVADKATCIARALTAMDTFGADYSLHSANTAEHGVHGWDLTENAYDGTITCMPGEGGNVLAVLTVFSEQGASRAAAADIAQNVKDRFAR